MCSSAGPKLLAFGSHCLANFQPILDCFIPNFKLKYEDSENIKADCVSTVVFNLHQSKFWAFFFGTPGRYFVARQRVLNYLVEVSDILACQARYGSKELTQHISVFCFPYSLEKMLQ